MLKGGAHIRVWMGRFWHHGIYLGGDEVIHFAGPRPDKGAATVRRGTLGDFAGTRRIRVVDYGRRLDGAEAAARAVSLLDRSGYDLLKFNCEHVARWCVTGDLRSLQVDTGFGVAGTTVLAVASPPLAVTMISEVAAAGLSGGSSTMSGLATAGGTFGAAGGIVAVATAPAVATALILNATLLRDDPHAPANVRAARASARRGSVVGVVIAAVGGLALVAMLGKPGLSANGISSGLKKLGRLVGRSSMVRGLVALALIGVGAVLATAAIAHYIAKRRQLMLPAA